MVREINLLILDLDGVITDGCVFIDENGRESKKIYYHDIDAVTKIHKNNIYVAIITGESSKIVEKISKTFGINHVIKGCKDKLSALKSLSKELKIPLSNICFVGDSDHDKFAIKASGLGVCPQNATEKAKAVSDIILSKNGGNGAIYELVTKYLSIT